jgi:carbon-monoxide dehydrogenase medium subunit
MRLPAIEAALETNWSPAAIDSVKLSAGGLLSDIHGSAGYRANLVKVMAQRAVTETGRKWFGDGRRMKCGSAPISTQDG